MSKKVETLKTLKGFQKKSGEIPPVPIPWSFFYWKP
jgi:hypothetical protein